MKSMDLTLTANNPFAMATALREIANLVESGKESSSGSLPGKVADYSFTVEGVDKTIADAFAEGLSASMDVALGDFTESDFQQLAATSGESQMVMLYLPNEGAGGLFVLSVRAKVGSDDIVLCNGINIDPDEASQAAYNEMFEELGYSGNFNVVAATEEVEKDMDALVAKRDEHIAGLVKDTMLNIDWKEFFERNPKSANAIAQREGWV